MTQNDVSSSSYVPSGHSFSGWLGGKSQLSKTIIEMMPPHKAYIEVFGGAAWVLFKKSPSKVEILNDINGDLVNLYRVVKYHFDAFVAEFEFVLFSRDDFSRLKKTDPSTLTDLQRAARFYYLVRTAFGGLLDGVFTSNSQRMTTLKLGEDLREHMGFLHKRLQQVTIENQHFEKLIPRMDRETSFFYIDPPYYAGEDNYGKGIFCRDDFYKLRDLLRELKGKFILSLNNVPEVHEIYGEFNIHSRRARWSVNNDNDLDKTDNELLICNF